jgi:hypothetical protein
MAITVFDVLKKNIEAERASAVDFLVGGSASDFAAYREVVGLIRGLESGLRTIEDLSRRYTEHDHEDD